jgi:hypothetical protein
MLKNGAVQAANQGEEKAAHQNNNAQSELFPSLMSFAGTPRLSSVSETGPTKRVKDTVRRANDRAIVRDRVKCPFEVSCESTFGGFLIL